MGPQTIYSFGFSEEGAYIDYVDYPSAVMFSLNECNLMFSIPTNSGICQGIFPNDCLGEIEVTHYASPLEYELNIRYENFEGKKLLFPLGRWGKEIDIIATWIDQVNLNIKSKKGLSSSAIVKNIINSKQLRSMSGHSLSWVRGNSGDYSQKWMDNISSRIIQLIKKELKITEDIGIQNKERWSSTLSWDTVFERMRIKNFSNDDSNCTQLHLCYELLYLSNDRSYEFDVVEVGRLNSASIIFHDRNVCAENNTASLVRETKNNITVNNFIEKFDLHNADNQKVRQHIATLIGTIPDFMINTFIAKQSWKQGNWDKNGTIYELIKRLEENKEDCIIFTDNAIAHKIKNIWEDTNAGGKLFVQKIFYSQPIPVGFPFDKRDIIWGNFLKKTICQTLNSKNNDIKDGWIRTIEDMQAMDITVNDVFLPAHMSGCKSQKLATSEVEG